MTREIIQECWNSLISIDQAMGNREISELCSEIFDILEDLSKDIR